VPLRDISEYHAWVERESPSAAARRVCRSFLAEVGDESWRAPSVPIEALSNQPEFEVREAGLEVDSEQGLVRVWYRHFYATDAVDVIAITNR
jgi:hypothetical protein